jgi:dienelactone hydrolase
VIGKRILIPALLACGCLRAQVRPEHAVAYFDFSKSNSDLSPYHRILRLHGVRWGAPAQDPMQARHGRVLEFTSALQYAETELSGALNEIRSATVGGWFYCRRTGEQCIFSRGLPEINSLGNRMFPPQPDWVNFVLGTDQHGFFMGTINGNGTMPFPYVTVNAVPINTWNQLVVVKDAEGYQKFYQNGELIHSNQSRAAAGKVWVFHDVATGEPMRLSMPQGGLIGEAWIFPRELSASEIRSDFQAKREAYDPAPEAWPVLLREMDEHPVPRLWKEPLSPQTWPETRRRILAGVVKVLGPFPGDKVPLEPRVASEEDCGDYIRRKVSIQVQPGDRMPAYLLIPKGIEGRRPAIICFYGTTSGAGKDTTVGLSGPQPGTRPAKNRDFAVTMVKAGFVAFAGDYLRDGERIKPGRRPYDTTDFYKAFPDWSIVGKDAWDNQRVVDYLQTLNFVDPDKIGMVGHSYGGHSTVFAAALEPRIKVAVANGPVSDFIHHGIHWGVPKGAANSQSLPGMRPYVLNHMLPPPVTFYEFTALIAPRPLLVGQAAGERRPMEEENCAAVSQVYRTLGYPDRVRYLWYAGDHDFPPEAQQAAVDWFRRWFQAMAGRSNTQ